MAAAAKPDDKSPIASKSDHHQNIKHLKQPKKDKKDETPPDDVGSSSLPRVVENCGVNNNNKEEKKDNDDVVESIMNFDWKKYYEHRYLRPGDEFTVGDLGHLHLTEQNIDNPKLNEYEEFANVGIIILIGNNPAAFTKIASGTLLEDQFSVLTAAHLFANLDIKDEDKYEFNNRFLTMDDPEYNHFRFCPLYSEEEFNKFVANSNHGPYYANYLDWCRPVIDM